MPEGKGKITFFILPPEIFYSLFYEHRKFKIHETMSFNLKKKMFLLDEDKRRMLYDAASVYGKAGTVYKDSQVFLLTAFEMG